MKKLFTFLAGAALLGSLSACSSDEPAKGPDSPEDNKGTGTMYMAVTISSADNASRAGETETPSDPDFSVGSSDEHNVTKANFYYFDEDGNYCCEAEVNNFSGTSHLEGTDDNIELESTNMLTLRNVKKVPKYMITLLNGESTVLAKITAEEPNIRDFSKITSHIRSDNTAKDFVMSTTSFFGGDQEIYSNQYYYANVLKGDWLFKEEPDVSTIPTDKIAVVYVERLAAKVTMTGFDTTPKKIDVTVAGKENSDADTPADGTPSAHSDVYVKLLGWNVSNVEEVSYLSKQLENVFDFNATTAQTPTIGNWAYASWNKPNYFRSYWGQSVNYGKETDFKTITAPMIDQTSVPDAIYTYETTNQKDKITKGSNNFVNYARVGSVVVLAQAMEKKTDGTYIPLELVEFGGIPYTKDHFLNVAMNRIPKYYMVESTTTGEGESTITYTNAVQVGVDAIKLVLRKDGTDFVGTGSVELTTNLGDATDLYEEVNAAGEGVIGIEKEGNTRYFKKIENGVSDLKAKLKSVVQNTKTVAFTKGYMFYTIPIEHLNKKTTDNANNLVVENEANYGIVRNHWYNVEIKSVLHLGHGIFIPEKVEGEEPQDPEPLNPDDPSDTYRMAANVKILSWKLVKQSIVL